MKKKNNTEPTIFLFKKMWEFSQGNRKKVVLYIFLSACAMGTMLLEPLIIAKFLNELQKNGLSKDNIGYLTQILLLSVGIIFLFWLFHGFSRILERKNAFMVQLNYRKHLFEKVLHFDVSWHSDRQSGDSIDKIEKASSSLFIFSENTFEMIFIVVKAVGIIIALLFFSVYISLGVFLLVTMGLFILVLFDKRLVPLYKEINGEENKISAKIYDSLSNITSIIILNIKKLVGKDVEKSFYLPFSAYKKRIVLNEKKWFFGDVFFKLIMVAPLISYMWILLERGDYIEVGTISALYLYLLKLSEVFFHFGGIYSKIIQYKADVENASEIDEAPSIINKDRVKSINVTNFEIKKLYFSYQKGGVNILKNINLKINFGEKIALIGASGSGKTTFLKLIHGLHNFGSGELIVNGKKKFSDFKELDLQTMLVPQEPELFTASIKENINFGVDCSEKELQKYINMACFQQTVEQLPNGLDSKVNEKGVNLSGGQKQRLALARALLFAKKKKIILLDESTSSVDPRNEREIYQNILQNFGDTTIISSIHKMNLLKFFDRIIMFENGEVVDDGNFEGMLETNKKFSKMWEEFSE